MGVERRRYDAHERSAGVQNRQWLWKFANRSMSWPAAAHRTFAIFHCACGTDGPSGGNRGYVDDAEQRVKKALESGRTGTISADDRGAGRQSGIVEGTDLLPSSPSREIVRAGRSGCCRGSRPRRWPGGAAPGGGQGPGGKIVIDPGAGAVLLVKPGERVEGREAWSNSTYRDPGRLQQARTLVEQACRVGDEEVTFVAG